jgi:hypothetical protein
MISLHEDGESLSAGFLFALETAQGAKFDAGQRMDGGHHASRPGCWLRNNLGSVVVGQFKPRDCRWRQGDSRRGDEAATDTFAQRDGGSSRIGA